jgi:polysaccharide export outer membrane protein
MHMNCLRARARTVTATFLIAFGGLQGCSSPPQIPFMNAHEDAPATADVAKYTYIIGPGDSLNVFVWRNPELSSTVAVRPDGKFSTPLVEDLQASGKTPSQLAREIEKKLAEYIRDPLVTVTVGGFIGEYSEQVRVVGEAAQPQAIPYRKNMTVLDVMIAVGGLTEFAAGNRASIVRTSGQSHEQYRVRLEDLVKDGEIDANVAMQPGDILIIPEAWF